MNRMRTILSKISEGKTIDALSRELDMRDSTVRAMLDSMVYVGYLEEILCGTGCRICPMKCSSPPFSRARMYAMTKKGMEYMMGTQI